VQKDPVAASLLLASPARTRPHHPEAAGLIERLNGLLKMQLQRQLGGNSMEGWGRVLQKSVYALNQCWIYGSFAHSQDLWVQESRGGKGNSSTYYHS
jgi:hypothetical protein